MKASAGDIIYIYLGEGGSLYAAMTVAGWLVLSKANGAEFWEGFHLRVNLRRMIWFTVWILGMSPNKMCIDVHT